MPQTYLRFVTQILDPDSGRRLGLFQAVRDLIDAKVLFDFELAELNTLREWFGGWQGQVRLSLFA